MDIAVNVLLMLAAMVAAAAGIGAVLAMKLSPRRRAPDHKATPSTLRDSGFHATRPQSGPAAQSPNTVRDAQSKAIKARIKALRASLHREHERAPQPNKTTPNFADTEVFEDGAEMPTMTMPRVPATPTVATAAPAAAAPVAPAFELLRLDFGAPPVALVPKDDARRGLSR